MYGSNKRKPTIAIDYDDTISLVPNFFKNMIENWKHAIDFYIVTYRDKNAYNDELREFEELVGHKVIFTSTKAKIDHFKADIWIDDAPLAITHNWKSYGYEIAESIKDSGDLIVKKCKWELFDTGKGYSNYMSGCRIQSGDLPIGFNFCPYCGGVLLKKPKK